MSKTIDELIEGYNDIANPGLITIPNFIFNSKKSGWNKPSLQSAVDWDKMGVVKNSFYMRYMNDDLANPLMLTINIPVVISITSAGTFIERDLDTPDLLLVGECKKGFFRRLFKQDKLVINNHVIDKSETVDRGPISSLKIYELGMNSKQSYYVIKALGGIDNILVGLKNSNKT